MLSLALLAMSLVSQVAGQSGASPATPVAPAPVLRQWPDADGVRRCMRRVRQPVSVRARCVLRADGRVDQCELQDPSPAALRYEAQLQCALAANRWDFSDGSPVEGVPLTTSIIWRGP